MNHSHAITLRSVSAGYGGMQVLDAVSLIVETGQRIVITGENGSGKSTLLKLVSGTLVPWQGEVAVLGVPLSNVNDRRRIRQRIGFLTQVQQDPELAISVKESVLLGLWGSHFSWMRRPSPEDREKVLAMLEMVGMATYANRDLRTLSGGQRQRAALARALIRNPALLLMDEPTTYLDAGAKEDLLAGIHELHDRLGFTLLMVSHEPVSARHADRIFHLEDMQVLQKVQEGA